MLLRPAMRPFLSCSMPKIGIRSFSSTSPSFLFRGSAQARTRGAAAIPLRQHPFLLTTLTATAITVPFFTSRSLVLHDSSPVADFSSSAYSHGKDAKVPISKDGGRSLNPAAVRQISLGSLLGLGLGVVVSAFSKMLVLVVGVGIVLTQYAARRGIYFLPTDKIQRYVKGVNVRSALNDNAAFKISFGLMFALTALGEF